MYKVGDFVWVQNAVVMSFGIIKQVPNVEKEKYLVQLVHCKNGEYTKGSIQEVYEKNLYNGMEHLNRVVQRQENYLSDLKLLYNVTSDEALKSLGIVCAL